MGRIEWHGAACKKQPKRPLAVHIGRRILGLRQKRQITLRTLSEEAIISQAFLCDMENGLRIPAAETLLRLAKYFGVKIDYFFKGFGEVSDGD